MVIEGICCLFELLEVLVGELFVFGIIGFIVNIVVIVVFVLS